MGTKFRTLLAPIGVSTGDGRRFAAGGISLADLPMPFEWARQREGGHDGAVVIGAVQEAKILTHEKALADGWISPEAAKGLDPKGQGVYGRGEMFDGVSREDMPRLAEDVAEAMHLANEGTLGPSVDLDSFEAKPVMAGSDDELTWEMVEEYMEANDGAEPAVELLITQGRVRAATLVSIPAFSETSRPLELIAEEATDGEPSGTAAADLETLVASMSALTASAAGHRPEVGAFALPVLDGPTAITWDWDNGRVFGHIATWATCHVGYEGVCVTPPKEDASYAWFNRHPVETSDGGIIAAGRITLGGRHAGLALSASAAMSAYDGKTVAAHVRAYADEHGIVVAGVIEPGLTGQDRAVLDRRKVSGDWREIGSGLSLVEVLALSPGPRAHSEPGFPVVETHVNRAGRQTALTASLGPDPVATLGGRTLSVEAIVRRTPAAERAEAARLAEEAEAREALARTVEADDNSRAEAARGAPASVLGEE
jgi:hypothetical protein